MGIKHLERDPKFENYAARSKNAAELVSILDDVFLTGPLSEWIKHFGKWDLLYSPVQNLSEVVADPQILANDYIIDFNHPVYNLVKLVGFPYKFSDAPLSVRRAPPELGQNTEEVLLEMGYGWEDIAQLRDSGVI
jgi:crotonobetainyl-CoA:carnitine CoA-transferase CaiB-like acyl-CoA transferase